VRTTRKFIRTFAGAMTANDHHQRCEPAANSIRIVTELNGWLSSAAWWWLDAALWQFLEKSFIIAVLQCNTHICACRLKNLRHPVNSFLTNVVQRHKLTSMDLSSQTLYLVEGQIRVRCEAAF